MGTYYYCTHCIPIMFGETIYPSPSSSKICENCGHESRTCREVLERANEFNSEVIKRMTKFGVRSGSPKRAAFLEFGTWKPRSPGKFEYQAPVTRQSDGWGLVKWAKMDEDGPNYELSLRSEGDESLGWMNPAVPFSGDLLATFGSDPARLEVEVIGDKLATSRLLCGDKFYQDFWVIPKDSEVPCIFRRWGINNDFMLDETLWRGMQTEELAGDFRVVV